METTASPLEFRGVTFRYGVTPALEDISFRVEKRDFVALIGPNGSGKTTLVRLAMGLERPQQGSVLLFGVPVQRFSERRRIGYVPQRASAFLVQFPATVSDVVSLGEFRGFDPGALFRRRISPRVEQALKMVGMWEYRRRLISELSGGQQQRVLISRALVHDPDLLVLDEPTTGIDKPGQGEFHAILRQLRETRGVTILLVSHDIGVVFHEANKVACVNYRLQCYAHPDDISDLDLATVYGHTADVVVHRHR